jgi:hypothetical protein
MTHGFGACFNPPGLTNFLGCVQSDIDLTAIQSLTFPPLSSSTTVTAAFVLDGVHFQSLGAPVTTVWQPDRIERSAEWRGLRLQSTTILPEGKTAVMVFVEIVNTSAETRTSVIGLNLQSTVTREAGSWSDWIPPKENDNAVALDENRQAFLFQATSSSAVSVQGLSFDHQHPSVEYVRNGIRSQIEIAPGETLRFAYANVLADTAGEALDVYDELTRRGRELVDLNEEFWNGQIAAIFDPASDEYGGHLPTLVTRDPDIRKLYWMGALGVIYFRRDSPHSVMGRTYDTLMPRYWQTVTFLWDYFLSAGVHAQLDPIVMKRYLEHWMHIDVYEHFGTEYLTGGPVGNWYSVNDFAMVSMIHEYVRWTGDVGWLSSRIQDSDMTVADYLEHYALKWKEFESSNGLADYGGINNLLECVSTYVHEVASLNAANVQNMRYAAELLALAGRAAGGPDLVREASELLDRLRQLYVDGAGYWNARYPDGTVREVRHCYDLLTVLNTIGDDLTDRERSEMVAFFKDELMTDAWMYALSPKDDNVLYDVRPDHQWTGAYPAWPPETAKGLFKVGEADLAFRWLKGLAASANQGPFGQAHFAETVVGAEDGGARKSPFEFPYITDWCCSSNGSWTMAVIEGLFGVRVTPDQGISATPQFSEFDPEARLENLNYQGRLYTVDRNGLSEQG